MAPVSVRPVKSGPGHDDGSDTDCRCSARIGRDALAYIGVFVAVVIAGISLAVSTAAAVLDRKRVLGLRGMPVSVLRKVIVQEAAVPLLAVLLLSVGLGFLVAWPSTEYYAALSLSLLLALAAVGATFGLVRSSTAITATRFE